MDFTLTEDQQAFRDTARQFATERMLPEAARWDVEKIFPEAVLREAAALGFGGIYVRDDVGGSGLSRFDAALIMEELAAACPSTAAYLSIHNMAAWIIDGFGDDEQRKRFLPKLCSMEHFASYCLTEPGAGSDAAALSTRAELPGDPVQAGRHGDRTGRSAADDLACRLAARRQVAGGPAGGRDGQAPGDRCRLQGGERRAATAWRLRLLEGLSHRAVSPGPARAPDPRRHQRDHAGDHLAAVVDGVRRGRQRHAPCRL